MAKKKAKSPSRLAKKAATKGKGSKTRKTPSKATKAWRDKYGAPPKMPTVLAAHSSIGVTRQTGRRPTTPDSLSPRLQQVQKECERLSRLTQECWFDSNTSPILEAALGAIDVPDVVSDYDDALYDLQLLIRLLQIGKGKLLEGREQAIEKLWQYENATAEQLEHLDRSRAKAKRAVEKKSKPRSKKRRSGTAFEDEL
jgi:hypothetical protein